MTTPDPSEAREMAGSPGVKLTPLQCHVMAWIDARKVWGYSLGRGWRTEGPAPSCVKLLVRRGLAAWGPPSAGVAYCHLTPAGRTALSHTARKDGDRDV